MYLLYTDASGAPELAGDRDLYVTVGVCIHEGNWFALDSRMRGLRRRFMFPGLEFEFHARDFCVTISEQASVTDFDEMDWASRRASVLEIRKQKLETLEGRERERKIRKFKSTDPFIHLDRNERRLLYTEALDLVGSHTGLVLFGEVCDKRHLLRMRGEQDAVTNNFTQLVARFESFVRRQNETGGSERREKGILVMDNEPSHEKRMGELMKRYRRDGLPWGDVQYVIENPFFVDSQDAMPVQAADLCAYAVRRYIERAENGAVPEREDFLRIFHKFDRQGARLHGLRHYCERASCVCEVCRARNHHVPPSDVARDGSGDRGC